MKETNQWLHSSKTLRLVRWEREGKKLENYNVEGDLKLEGGRESALENIEKQA